VIKQYCFYSVLNNLLNRAVCMGFDEVR